MLLSPEDIIRNWDLWISGALVRYEEDLGNWACIGMSCVCWRLDLDEMLVHKLTPTKRRII